MPGPASEASHQRQFRAVYDLAVASTRTLMFTDIEGSTELVRRLGGRYLELLELHRSVVRGAIGQYGGVEHGTEGDSFFVSFPQVDAALSAAGDHPA